MFFVLLQDKVIDPFVVYKDILNYSSLKEVLNEALFAKQIDTLTEDTQVIHQH